MTGVGFRVNPVKYLPGSMTPPFEASVSRALDRCSNTSSNRYSKLDSTYMYGNEKPYTQKPQTALERGGLPIVVRVSRKPRHDVKIKDVVLAAVPGRTEQKLRGVGCVWVCGFERFRVCDVAIRI